MGMDVFIMNNIYDEINSVIMESSLSVLDAMMSLIDKNNTINEYSENSSFSDIFLESMMIFMESKNRERDKTPRDEIAKWMESNGYWYTGDNPKKKKECNRMYHFLQQHKFDPKTETYESDIDDGKGGKKRIKLAIDYDDSEFEPNRSIHNPALKDNAWYSTYTKGISIGSPTLKGKQQNSQFTLKHEEGHANHHDKQPPRNQNISNVKNAARQFIDDTKRSGQFINSHDDNSEELYADLYSAKHSKIRTKGAGENHGQTTRNFNKKDVEKAFNKISHTIKESTANLSDTKEYYDRLIKDLEVLRDSKINECSTFRKFDIGSPGAMNKFSGIFKSDDASKFISYIDDLSDLIDDIKSNKYHISKAKYELDQIKSDGNDVSSKQKEIDKLIELQTELIDELQLCQKRLNRFKKRRGFDISQSTVLNIERIITKYRGIHLKDIPEQDKKVVQDFLDSVLIPKLNKRIEDIETEITSAKKLRETIETDMEHSTKMRFDFVKKFVKEYFEELYDEYIYYD